MSRTEKYIVLLGDGMADRPLDELDGRTPLMAARTPNMDRIASGGTLGTIRTIPDGMALGSDVANLSVLGYDPKAVYTGRSPIEAAGMGVKLGPSDVAYRCNLVTLGRNDAKTLDTDLADTLSPDNIMIDFAGGHPTDNEASGIISTLAQELVEEGIEFHRGVSYRHLMVWRNGMADLTVGPPHDLTDGKIESGWPRGAAAEKILGLMKQSVKLLKNHPVNTRRVSEGKKPVNCIWLWGQGFRPGMQNFREVYGLDGAMITAVDLLKGLGVSIGFEVVDVPGATGYLDTNYEGKASAAIEALKRVDIVYLHVEAPDEAGHSGSLPDKIMAIENFDKLVVGPVLDDLKKLGPHRVLLMPDHATPLKIKTHSGDAVPFAVFDSTANRDTGKTYDEVCAASTGIHIENGYELMEKFVKGEI